VISEPWDVVLVPFPFVERAGAKRRPALVISSEQFNTSGNTVLSMITSKGHRPWPGDVEISDRSAGGLPAPCILRLKLFTLDNRLILRRLGRLSSVDRANAAAELGRYVCEMSGEPHHAGG
jgi:mRNA interferase MazF